MSDANGKNQERPSAATTAAPRTSGASQPLLNSSDGSEIDRVAPELTSSQGERVKITVDSSTLSRSNLAVGDHSQSGVGERADVPAGSVSDELVGLTEAAAAQKLLEVGRNEIPEIDTPWYVLLGKQFIGVMPIMLWIAAIVSACIPDWADFAIIMAMLILNALIGFHEEHKAKQSLDALKSQMTATVPVKRDGQMKIMEVAELVPGDIIFLRGGNIVPADCKFIRFFTFELWYVPEVAEWSELGLSSQLSRLGSELTWLPSRPFIRFCTFELWYLPEVAEWSELPVGIPLSPSMHFVASWFVSHFVS